jgi:hypothetical protein
MHILERTVTGAVRGLTSALVMTAVACATPAGDGAAPDAGPTAPELVVGRPSIQGHTGQPQFEPGSAGQQVRGRGYSAAVGPDSLAVRGGAPDGASDGGVAVRTVSVRRGAGGWAAARQSAPAWAAASPHALSTRRGTAIEELEALEGALEQRWRFERAPAGEGDLVVQVEITGAPHAGSDNAGLHFGAGAGAILYGHATWFDANGEATFVEARWTGRHVELVVPADVLERSTYPALLDPVIGPAQYLGDPQHDPLYGGSISHWAVASDGESYLVLYWASSTLAAVRIGADGTPIDRTPVPLNLPAACGFGELFWGGGTYILFCPQDFSFYSITREIEVGPQVRMFDAKPTTLAPDIAFNGSQFLVVWHTGGTESDIHGARVDGSGTNLDPTPMVVADGPLSQTEASVAWLGEAFYVAYQDRRHTDVISVDIRATLVGEDGLVDNTDGDIVAADPSTDEFRPNLLQGLDGALLTWRQGTAPGWGALHATRVSTAGALLDDPRIQLGSFSSDNFMRLGDGWLLRGSNAGDATFLSSVDGSTRTYPLDSVGLFRGTWAVGTGLMVWTHSRTTSQHTLFSATVGPHGLTSDPDPVISSIPAQYWVDLASHGAGYTAYTIEEESVGFSTNRMKLRHLAHDGSEVAEPSLMSTLTFYSTRPALHTLTYGDGNYLWVRWLGSIRELRVNGVDASGQRLHPFDFSVSTSSWNTIRRFSTSWTGAHFLLVWDNHSDMFGRLFDATGNAIGTSNFTFTSASGTQTHPEVAFSGNSHLLVWEDTRNLSTSGRDVFALRLSDTGTPLDLSAIAMSTEPEDQTVPQVAPLDDGWLVAWADGRPEPDRGVYVRKVDHSGSVVGPAAAHLPSGSLVPTDIAIARGGAHVLLVWRTGQQPYELHGVVLDGEGQPVTAPTLIDDTLRHTHTSFRPRPRLASVGGDDWLLAYTTDARPESTSMLGYTRHITYGVPLGTACSDSASCGGKPCVDGVCCNEACGGGDGADCQACSTSAGGAVDGVCGPVSEGLLCRASAGVCDVAEHCDGVSPACPTDQTMPDGTDCDDGNPCDGTATCIAGTCTAGPPPDCDDDNVCNGLESCEPYVGCVPGSPLDCDDGDVCNGQEVCDPAMGCGPGTPITCDDGDPCTANGCDPEEGCLHTTYPDGTPCGHNLICSAGVCVTDPATIVDPVPLADAGQPVPDGGVLPDGAPLDGAEDPGDAPSSGSRCSTAGPTSAGGSWWVLLLLLPLVRPAHRRGGAASRTARGLGLWAALVALPVGCADDAWTPQGPPGEILEFDAGAFDPAPLDSSVPDGSEPGEDASGGGSDTRLFVPDVPITYGGTFADPQLEVIAHTVREGTFGHQFLLAVRHTGSVDVICALSIRSTFFDAAGTQIASTADLGVDAYVYRSTGLLNRCIGPGQIAMQKLDLDLGLREVEDIASITWQSGGIIITDASPTSVLSVSAISTVTDPWDRERFTGSVRNNGTVTLTGPAIEIYGVNAVGRPLFSSGALESTTIPPGGTWSFETFPGFTESYSGVWTFPRAREL